MIQHIKKAKVIFLAFFLFAFFIFSLNSHAQKTVKRVVVDAGHGGKDNGAEGKFSTEKDVSLSVALKLQKMLETQIKDIDVLMTRTTDIYDNPRVKANKANDFKGDLFIAIHCNSTSQPTIREQIGTRTMTVKKGRKRITKEVPVYKYSKGSASAKGTETYIWGLGKAEEKEQAVREHEDLFMDSTMQKELKDFDPSDPTKMMLYSLKTQQYFDRSYNLANTVEDEFVKVGRISRGARQRNEKGIWVLQAVAMPAILVEIGFISNAEEEEFMNSEEGQKQIAQCIANAVKRYKNSLETKTQKVNKEK
jgi:N-acetylmuramoyl-L-alanine amidase